MEAGRKDQPGRCQVLDWAASGAMALTGWPDGGPALSPAPSYALLGSVCQELARVTAVAGREVLADPAELLTGRAALAGLDRQGQVSAGGSSRLLRAADGWCALTLSRADDTAAVPAIVGRLGLGPPRAGASGSTDIDGAWTTLAAAALVTSAADLADAAQLLGVPAAALPAAPAPRPGRPSKAQTPAWPPWRRSRLAPRSSPAGLAGALVVDLSSMWAGPLCGRLLGLAGARVVKVESLARPDGARAGNKEFFDWLHTGQASVAVDFSAGRGLAALAALLGAADVVIEASRPRALANLGLAPGTAARRAGQVWLSITGYGREEPERVAFGDDAAVAGGLVGWLPGRGPSGEADPVFCADAVADPLSGACGALAVARSLADGGGELIDLSMRSVAAAFAAATGDGHGAHELSPDGATVTCGHLETVQAVLPPRRPWPVPAATGLGADTEAVLARLGSC